jgi:bis(5'-nucleosyl)-tetraphosphatase (symmetrical)
MAHYVIGDVQGCFEELLDLTKLIEFSSINDRLIFAGD